MKIKFNRLHYLIIYVALIVSCRGFLEQDRIVVDRDTSSKIDLGADFDLKPNFRPDLGHKQTDQGKEKDLEIDAGEFTPGSVKAFDIRIPKGFPNSTTTGLKTPLSDLSLHEGNYQTKQKGEIIENMIITGFLMIQHENVIVRNCRVYGGEHFAVSIRKNGTLIEDSEFGLPGRYSVLTKDVHAGDDTIEVKDNIPKGSYILLSSMGAKLRTFRVKKVEGGGPYILYLERHYHEPKNGKEVIKIGPPGIEETHPEGATISFYDPTDAPLPSDGIASSGVLEKTIRRCSIHHVNDGFKMDNGIYEDNYVHELIYIPKSHLDSVQSTQGIGAKLRHNSLIAPWDANGIQLSAAQGPLKNLTIEYNYLSGGSITLRWGVSGGTLKHNRFARDFRYNAALVYPQGSIDLIKDNRFVEDGQVVPTSTDARFGDKNGDGSGSSNVWGTGFDPKYALPGN